MYRKFNAFTDVSYEALLTGLSPWMMSTPEADEFTLELSTGPNANVADIAVKKPDISFATINGTPGDDVFDAYNLQAGDIYNALGGDDEIVYSIDQFVVAISKTVNGGDGFDFLQIFTGAYRNYGSDTLDGDNDFGGTVDITNSVSTGTYGPLAISGFERLKVEGGGYSDLFRGGDGNDELNDGGFATRVDGNGSQDYGLGGRDELYGMGGDDIIAGTGGQDILDGGDGNDVIHSGGGYNQGYYDAVGNGSYSNFITSNATMIGGAGDDTLYSRGEDTLEGGAGDDILINQNNAAIAVYSSSNASDYIITEIAPGEYTIEAIGGTGEGTDTLTGIETIRLGGINGTDYAIGDLAAGGENVINLTILDDVYSGPATDVTINALGGNDIFDGGAGNNTLNGGDGNDIITSLGNDIINGGNNNDLVELGGGILDASTFVDGGSGVDTLSFSTFALNGAVTQFLVVDLLGQAFSYRENNVVQHVENFAGFENATGSEFRDLLQGSNGNNVLTGLSGDDTLQGRSGNDTLYGGAGDNDLQGGDGNDWIISEGNDIIDGGDGDDTVDIGAGIVDNSTAISGGLGIDTLSLSSYVGNVAAVNFIVIDLQSQSYSIRENGAIIAVDQFNGFENANRDKLSRSDSRRCDQ